MIPECEYCGAPGSAENPVRWQENPFAADVMDDHKELWLCEFCAYQLAMDI